MVAISFGSLYLYLMYGLHNLCNRIRCTRVIHGEVMKGDIKHSKYLPEDDSRKNGRFVDTMLVFDRGWNCLMISARGNIQFQYYLYLPILEHQRTQQTSGSNTFLCDYGLSVSSKKWTKMSARFTKYTKFISYMLHHRNVKLTAPKWRYFKESCFTCSSILRGFRYQLRIYRTNHQIANFQLTANRCLSTQTLSKYSVVILSAFSLEEVQFSGAGRAYDHGKEVDTS